MHVRRQLPRAGFTLLEVLLALGLFAAASAVMVQSAYNAITAYEAVQNNSNHEQLFRFVLRSIVSIEDQEEFEDGGDIELPDDSTANWEVELEDGGMVDLFRVMVEIELESDESDETRNYEVFLYRPDWTPVDGDREQILSDRRQVLEDNRGGF